MSNARLLVNRACIYERRLPGDAYITAHVQRLQHGYYSSPAVSDNDAAHVDFLAVNFTFHSSHTLSHRFKSATVRVAIEGASEVSGSAIHSNGEPTGNPRFLMHAPHLLYGTVSPETMEWTFSLAGSLGISETPVSASVIPSGSVNGRYRRYEMMRIQGSARTHKSPRGPDFDIEAGEILWSLEENNLQRSGLPREFTFVMLIQKPAANSEVNLTLDIEPVLQTWYGSYPKWMLGLSTYQPLPRRSVDFNREVGQRFEPVETGRGFNWAALVSSVDDYIAMPGRKFTRQVRDALTFSSLSHSKERRSRNPTRKRVKLISPKMQIPQDNGLPDDHVRRPYPGEYGPLNPNQQLQYNGLSIQNNSLSLQNNLLYSHLRQLQQGPAKDAAPPSTRLSAGEESTNTFNVRLFVDNAVPGTGLRTADDGDWHGERGGSDLSTALLLANNWVDDETRARVLRGKVYSDDSTEAAGELQLGCSGKADRGRVMMLANVPLTQSLLSTLSQMSR